MKKKFNKLILYAIIAVAIVFGVLICLFIDVIKKYAVYICVGIFVVGLFIYELVLRLVEKRELKKQEQSNINVINDEESNQNNQQNRLNINSQTCDIAKVPTVKREKTESDSENKSVDTNNPKIDKNKIKKSSNNFSLFLTPDEVERASKYEMSENLDNSNSTKQE